MSSWLDLVGSFIVTSFIILIVANINLLIASSSSEILFSNIAQADLSNTLDIVEHDFYKMGYGSSGSKVLTAQEKEIQFSLDIDNNGSSDLLKYFVGDTDELEATKNPEDKILYRSLNDERAKQIGFVTDFELSYYDSTGSMISYASLEHSAARKNIRSVQIYIKVESPEPVDSTYQGAEWQRLISPKNLK